MASSIDPAFQGAGSTPGLELWRIEGLKPVKQEAVTGHLFKGDAYIILSTTKKRDGSSALQYSVHFWLGSEASQDEIGVAAFKTVELDDALGGAAVQYREVEGHESALFLSYFKSTGGLRFLAGGVKSGFNKVERDVWPTRLLHIKGARVVRATEVPLAHSSLNTSDCFLLDKGLKLFLYNGPEANGAEKAKALELALRIRDLERGGRAEVILANEWGEDDKEIYEEVWAAFGEERKPVTKKGEMDDVVEQAAAKKVSLARVSDSSGELTITPVVALHGRLVRSMLDGKNVFVLDTGSVTGGVYVWVGKETTAEEKKGGMRLATTFLEKSHRPVASTPIVRVMEGGETALFISYFAEWNAPLRSSSSSSSSASSGVAPSSSLAAMEGDALDLSQGILAQKEAAAAAAAGGGGDGKGVLQVWRVEKMEKVEVPQSQHGHFYSGDSYLILYTYQKGGREGGREEQIIYMWQGAGSGVDERGACALLAIELDQQQGGRPVQVRVVQGKEPAHFRRFFQGRLVVHTGGVESGFSSARQRGGSEEGKTPTSATAATAAALAPALFQVKGTTAENTYAVQVPATAMSLNSGDCFILSLPQDGLLFVWVGGGSNAAEREAAVVLGEVLLKQQQEGGGEGVEEGEVEVVEEGEEPDDFWTSLGGLATYPKGGRKGGRGEVGGREARLWLVMRRGG